MPLSSTQNGAIGENLLIIAIMKRIIDGVDLVYIQIH